MCVDRSHVRDNARPVGTLLHVRYCYLAQVQRRPEHDGVHQIILLHGEVFHRIDVLDAGYVRQVLDGAHRRGFLNGLLYVGITGEVCLEKGRFTARAARDLRCLRTALLVNVQAENVHAVHRGCHSGCSAYAAARAGDYAHVAVVERLVCQNEDVLFLYLPVFHMHDSLCQSERDVNEWRRWCYQYMLSPASWAAVSDEIAIPNISENS